MAMFTGFKPQGLQKIASKMGYAGRMEEFDQYLQQNPDKQREMIVYQGKAQEMARGGYISKLAIGGIASANASNLKVGPFPMNPPIPGMFGGDNGIRTMAIGEDDPNRGNFEGRLPGPTDEFNATTAALGEEDRMPIQQLLMAVGEEGDTTMAKGEDGGGGDNLTTMAFGEEDSDRRPDPTPPPPPTYVAQPKDTVTTPVNTTQQPTNAGVSYTPAGQAYVPTLGTGTGQIPAFGTTANPKGITDATTILAQTGAIPVGGVTQPQLTPQQADQFVAPDTGKLITTPVAATYGAETAQADPAQNVTATQSQAIQATPAVATALQANQAAQADLTDPRAQVVAAQQAASSVGNLNAAQGNATLLDNPVQRQIQNGELVSGVADAQVAASFTEQVQAATATPSEQATVQGQLATLTENFDASNPPAWAAGTLRAVQAQMAARGLGASSMAGQAMIQGALESALPIAQADAETNAKFESQNLSNRQQRAMLAAEQRATFLGLEFTQEFQARVQNSARIGDIANANFTAEQSIALENSRAVNTMNLNNLSNKQALVMGEASALANLDLSNLSNNQQAAVQTAQNFLQKEMANLTNEQQTSLFKGQAINQALLTDQAAQNAASQFNATSDNQTKQFMSNLASTVSQFNSTQANAQSQFNAGELNTLSRFNTEVANQRDQFNAQNQLVIAQNNAVWRREIATADTTSINRANELNAKAVLDIAATQYNNLWSFYADTMEWAWRSAEGDMDRNTELAKANIDADSRARVAAENAGSQGASAIGGLIGTLGSAAISAGLFGGCWVAREVYGEYNPQWFMFRLWLKKRAPKWFHDLYMNYGEGFASFISNKPNVKGIIRYFMNRVKL
jgi:hypothetical protein